MELKVGNRYLIVAKTAKATLIEIIVLEESENAYKIECNSYGTLRDWRTKAGLNMLYELVEDLGKNPAINTADLDGNVFTAVTFYEAQELVIKDGFHNNAVFTNVLPFSITPGYLIRTKWYEANI